MTLTDYKNQKKKEEEELLALKIAFTRTALRRANRIITAVSNCIVGGLI